MNQDKSIIIPYLMWLLPLSFFTYQFILRLFPSLIMGQLMHKFVIDATAFGLLASVYYYGYASLQIPFAIMLDRYKSKYVISFGIGLCGTAVLIFNVTESWYLLLFSRFLIGAGSAVAFLAVSKIASMWFKPDLYAKIIGYSFTIGLCGAIYGGRPINILIEEMGWQTVGYILAIIAFIISTLVFFFLRESKIEYQNTNKDSKNLDIKNYGILLKNPTIWLVALSNLLMVGSLEGFADIWGVNYLITAYSMTKSEAAQLTSFIFLGMLFGGPLLAILANKYGNYKILIVCGIGMGLIFCLLLIFKEILNHQMIAVLFWCLGNLCCYQVIIFSAGANLLHDTKLLGITIAFLNSINMLGGSFFHSIIGFMMDKSWNGTLVDGIRQYDLNSYDIALMVIPICAFIGSILIFALKFINVKAPSNIKL